jgi:hypothetical protein
MSGARHRRQRPEAAIHAAVCDHLRLRAKPDVLWLHPANGGTRDIREAARARALQFASAEGVDRAIACLEGWGLLVGRRQ